MLMTESIAVISKILPVIFLIALGGVFRKTQYVSPQIMAGMKKIAINISLPLIIFLSLIDLDFRVSYLILVFLVFAILVILLLAGMAIRRLTGSPNRYLPVLFTSFENGMMGYGILGVLFGMDNIYPIVIMDLGQTLFFSLVFVTLMGVLNGGAASPKSLLIGLIKTPYIWASVLSLTLRGTGLITPIRAMPPLAAVLDCAGLLSNLATPIMCLVIGYELKIDTRRIGKPALVVLARSVLLLSIAFLFNTFVVNRWLHLEAIFETSVYTMFMLPPFFVGSLLIKDEAVEEKGFSVNVISLNILLFLFLFALMNALIAG
jgi:predicted permease